MQRINTIVCTDTTTFKLNWNPKPESYTSHVLIAYEADLMVAAHKMYEINDDLENGEFWAVLYEDETAFKLGTLLLITDASSAEEAWDEAGEQGINRIDATVKIRWEAMNHTYKEQWAL